MCVLWLIEVEGAQGMSGIYRICSRECCPWRRLCVAVPGNAEVRCVFLFFFFLYIFEFIFGIFFFFIHRTHTYIHLFYVNCCCGRAKWHSFTIIISFFRLCFSFFAWLLGRPRGYGPCLPFRLTHFHQPFLLYFFFYVKRKEENVAERRNRHHLSPLERRS